MTTEDMVSVRIIDTLTAVARAFASGELDAPSAVRARGNDAADVAILLSIIIRAMEVTVCKK